MSFLLYLLTPLGLAGLIPSIGKVLATLVESLGPILRGASEGLVWFVKTLWEGLLDVVDNIKTVIFVVFVIACAWVYVDHKASVECEAEIVEVKKKLSPKTKPKAQTEQLKWPWEDLFK